MAASRHVSVPPERRPWRERGRVGASFGSTPATSPGRWSPCGEISSGGTFRRGGGGQRRGRSRLRAGCCEAGGVRRGRAPGSYDDGRRRGAPERTHRCTAIAGQRVADRFGDQIAHRGRRPGPGRAGPGDPRWGTASENSRHLARFYLAAGGTLGRTGPVSAGGFGGDSGHRVRTSWSV